MSLESANEYEQSVMDIEKQIQKELQGKLHPFELFIVVIGVEIEFLRNDTCFFGNTIQTQSEAPPSMRIDIRG